MGIMSLVQGALNVAGAFVPGVAVAAKLVNALLPDNETLNEQSATGQDVINAYHSLPDIAKDRVDKQAEIEFARINASVDKLQAMVSAETASGNTRPFIAVMMAWAVLLAVLFMMLILGKAVWIADNELLEQLAGAWPLVLSIIATPTALLRAYFGMRTQEKHARYAAATGQPIADAVGGLLKIFKK